MSKPGKFYDCSEGKGLDEALAGLCGVKPLDGGAAPKAASPLNGKPETTATALLALGFWPTVIYPSGVEREDKSQTTGKEPIGSAWGLSKITLDQISRRFRRHPEASVGICLGPERGPKGEWIADFEGDGPAAEDSFRALVGSEESRP